MILYRRPGPAPKTRSAGSGSKRLGGPTQDPLTWPLCEKFIGAYDSHSAGRRIMVRGDPMYEWSSRAGSECKRATGTIKTWNVQKQFGFVLCGNEELFLHVARMTKPDETESVLRCSKNCCIVKSPKRQSTFCYLIEKLSPRKGHTMT